MKILVVDDETTALTSVQRLLRRKGIRNVEICDNGTEAIRRINAESFDIVLLDILMPETSGLHVLEATKAHRPSTEFIVVTAVEDVATSVKAMRLGAYDYLIKPLDPDRLCLSIEHAYERKSLKIGQAGAAGRSDADTLPAAFKPIVTADPRMIEICQYVHVMANAGRPVLIVGETGTGKELFARAVHEISRGPAKPFVPVNVSSVPESLFESQFYGHAKGAYTGASGCHRGYSNRPTAAPCF